MIQRWLHPCWPSGTSDNTEAVLTLTVDPSPPRPANNDVEMKQYAYLKAALSVAGS